MPASRTIGLAALVVGLLILGAGPASSSAQVTQGDFAPLSTTPPGVEITGHATMIRTGDGRTKISVEVSGLDPDKTYASHVHSGLCSTTSTHYKYDPNGAGSPPNELWVSSDPQLATAGLTANSAGNASGHGTAPWTAANNAQSVVIHDPALPSSSNRIACADLA
jgi:hypothetical protein